jgi:hypothetical protein
VVDSYSKSESSFRDCSEHSVCAQSWIDSRPSEFEEYFFDSDERIELSGFGVMSEEVEENLRDGSVDFGGVSGADWSPKIYIKGIVSILIEILVGHTATQSSVSNDQSVLPPDLPMFVLEMISADQSDDRGLSARSTISLTF